MLSSVSLLTSVSSVISSLLSNCSLSPASTPVSSIFSSATALSLISVVNPSLLPDGYPSATTNNVLSLYSKCFSILFSKKYLLPASTAAAKNPSFLIISPVNKSSLNAPLKPTSVAISLNSPASLLIYCISHLQNNILVQLLFLLPAHPQSVCHQICFYVIKHIFRYCRVFLHCILSATMLLLPA